MFRNDPDKNFNRICRAFSKINNANLKIILRDNADTFIGRKYGFSGISSAEEFTGTVPVSSARDYAPLVRRMMDGEENVLTSYPLYCYVATSGSAGSRKIFPLTLKALQRYGTYIDDKAVRTAEGTSGKRLFINMLRVDPDKPIRKDEPMLLSEAYYRYQYETGDFDPDRFIGGKELNFLSSEDIDYFYAKIWAAFTGEKTVTMESIFLYDILLFFAYLKKNGEKIISDMKNRCIPDTVKLSLHVKQELLKMDIDDIRLDNILEECSKGFDGIAKRIFPGLKLISGIGSRPSLTEEVMLKRFTGDIPISHFCYVASECHLGIPVGEYDYVLLPLSCFYEFRPIDEYTDRTIRADELLEGRDYELIITTFNGLYRYELGDVVTVTGFVGQTPVVRFQYRKDLMLNIAGEKLDELTLESAMRRVEEKYSLSISEYFARADYKELPGRYEIIVCAEKSQDPEGIASELDSVISDLSCDYYDLRRMGEIGHPVIRIFDEERYSEIKSRFMSGQGHVKPMHIVSS